MRPAVRAALPSVVAVVVALAFVVAAADQIVAGTAPRPDPRPAVVVAVPASVSAPVGTWTRVGTCAELRAALDQAGVGEFLPAAVLSSHLRPGFAEPVPGDVCDATVARTMSRVFTADRRLRSLDGTDRPVDDVPYRITGDRTIAVEQYGDVDLEYRVDGDTLVLDVHIPTPCVTSHCRLAAQYAVALAFPGLPWRRAV